ncbi:MAG: rhomboid family intramembrane serine protease [Deltaproteobacteria bacterium]|nr:rhomboid family intramembrane serine protease [Deltaproteobacteria bacterium]
MFPIKDENPHYLTPFVTYALVAANVASWVFVQGLGQPSLLVGSICELGLIPGEVLGRVAIGTRVELGDAVCVIGESGRWHTLVSSMFLHGGWMHLIGNLWFLWIFGNNVEDSMGHGRFVVFYLLCGLAAAGIQMAADPGSSIPMVGASGAIGGVMGAYIVLYPRVHVHMLIVLGFYVTRIVVPAVFMLGYWFGLQLLGGAVSLSRTGQGGVAFWAHVGGFVAGGLLIFGFRKPALVARHPYHGWRSRRR